MLTNPCNIFFLSRASARSISVLAKVSACMIRIIPEGAAWLLPLNFPQRCFLWLRDPSPLCMMPSLAAVGFEPTIGFQPWPLLTPTMRPACRSTVCRTHLPSNCGSRPEFQQASLDAQTSTPVVTLDPPQFTPCPTTSRRLNMVLGEGVEPSWPKPGDFKSPAYSIPPPEQIVINPFSP